MMNKAPYPTRINYEDSVHAQVRIAASRVKEFLTTLPNVPNGSEIIVTVKPDAVIDAGKEGYVIQSTDEKTIKVTANADTGAANGLYGLMMAIKTKQLSNPFDTRWGIMESPHWPDRRVSVASFLMGMTKMTPDMWTFPDWQEYVDFIRGFNINRLMILGLHQYHPDIPETYQNKWRLDNYKQLIAYAHDNGMKVNILTGYNMVPAEFAWQHPELRTEAVPGYFGHALCWSKAKDIILKYQTFLIDYLEGLDGIEVMVTEPLGWCLCDECRSDMGAVWVDATKEFRKAIRKNNPEAEVVFWNWLIGYLPALKGFYPPTTEIPNLESIQKKVLADLPDDVIFTDLSRNQMIKSYGENLASPDLPEILDAAPAAGYRTINYMFYMDKEFGMLDHCSLFPRPFLDMTLEEFKYTLSKPVSGACSYRLAPPGRFLSDFFFMRLAWNPHLTKKELLDEAAGYLTENTERKPIIAEAIKSIEKYWHERKHEDLIKARDAFESVANENSGKDLLRIRDGLNFLAMVDNYARTVKEFEQQFRQNDKLVELGKVREEKLLAIYSSLKQYPLYQGLTTDGFWEPRAITMLLRPNMDMWANYINNLKYYD